MLLKSMEVQGFKTFPDKTKLTFERGITAVVGPNGSGKSNISDAIRWVLGEQSAKALRCSKMEDVVFNGTDSRKRQGFAEVTLTIDNKDRALPFDGDSIAVTRRYYRSGESEYLINKSSVRLKDINELFMDTGLGRDGYSMIGQGKIDSIVSSKSEDRREIFEEAAGISRYRYRKTEAERQLERTENNLVRLRDIVTELEERVGPLEIQSKKAQSFLKYSEEKKGLEIALWLDSLNKSSDMLKEQEDKISVARSHYSQIESELEEISAQTETIYLENGKLSSQADEIRRKSNQWSEEQSEKKSRMSVLANDILHNNQTINRLNEELSALDAVAEDTKAFVEQKNRQISEIEGAALFLRSEYSKAASELNRVTLEAGRSGDEYQSLSQRLANLNAEYADCRVNIVTCETSREEIRNHIVSAENLRVGQEQKIAQLKKTAEQYNMEYTDSANKLESLKNSIDGIELKLGSRKKRIDQLKSLSDSLFLDAKEKSRRAVMLENFERNLEGFAYSVKAVVQGARDGVLRGICGPVSKIISVSKQYTLAIETALGGAMQYIVTETEDDAKRAIRFLSENNKGRATFLPVSTIKGKMFNETGLENAHGFIGIASDLCTCDVKYRDILSSLLGRIVVAKDLDCAVSIAKKFGYRFKAVSLDGQVVNSGGSLTGGSTNKKSGLLTRTAEIEEFKRESRELAAKAEQAKTEYLSANDSYASLEAQYLGSQADYNRLLQESVRIETERKACMNDIRSSMDALERSSIEISDSDRKVHDLDVKINLETSRLNDLSEKISELEKRLSDAAGNRSGLSGKREELSETLQKLSLEILASEKDVESLKNEISSARDTDMQRLDKKKAIEEEIEAMNRLNHSIGEQIEQLKSEAGKLTKSIDSLDGETEKINRRREELERKTVELRRIEREKTDGRENISKEIARLEERRVSLQKQYDEIISKLWEEYELTRRQAEEVGLKIENISEAQKRLNELKQKIKALGNVNVAAIEEYKEVSERYGFISAQVSDVENSKKEIESLISRLTKQMKESFAESFNEINSNFSETFRELFGGGTASLALSEPDNILESGIDLLVHPPGKTVSHLDALSGGEKALVAIALYFAIMKVRPAPFCVLDETEAALDEVNVDRFARYMRTMCLKTQFICITHRRGTMEEADVLYGVTMQDRGVSKLLELRTGEVAAKLGIQ